MPKKPQPASKNAGASPRASTHTKRAKSAAGTTKDASTEAERTPPKGRAAERAPLSQSGRAWSDLAVPADPSTRAETGAMHARAFFRVPNEAVTVHTDPATLPEMPRSSSGLFELVNPVARRALALGLAAREPSFHVFVAASSDVMIEDDIVRYAERYAASRPTPNDVVYVHDFDSPAAPRPLCLPPGTGPELVAAMEGLIERLRAEIPTIAERDEIRKAQSKLADELETKNRAVIGDLESTAKTLGFGVRSVQGGVQTFPILHGKPLSAEQFGALDESTKRALASAEERLTREVEKAAQRVRAQGAKFEAESEEAFSVAARRVIDQAMEQLAARFASQGESVRAYFTRVRESARRRLGGLLVDGQADDTAQGGGDGPPQGGDPPRRPGPRARDAPQPLPGEPPRRERARVARSRRVRHEPHVSEPLRLPRAARTLRRPP